MRVRGVKHPLHSPGGVPSRLDSAGIRWLTGADDVRGDAMTLSKPVMLTIEERIDMGVRCRDADAVPKVADAGMVRYLADGQRIQVMHNGLKVVADGYYGAWMTRLIELCQGHHEAQEERLFHELVSRLPQDAVMLELGAFWAYYSLWFLQGAPGRRAVSVEPDPIHLDVGRRNAALNGPAPEL